METGTINMRDVNDEVKFLYEAAFQDDDSDMYPDEDELTDAQKDFVKMFQNFIKDLLKDTLVESFKTDKSLKKHFHDHCKANGTETSSKSSALYDFKDIKDYEAREDFLFNTDTDFLVMSLTDVNSVIKAFRLLAEGDKTIVFNYSCGFVTTHTAPQSAKILFHSFANDVTTNYFQNTVDFMIYNDLYTWSLFPLDLSYVENKFNNLVVKWNTKYNKPFKVNR